MKTIIFLLFGMVCCIGTAYSQDTLFIKNQPSLVVKVLEIDAAEIKYKKFDNVDGPTYVIKRKYASKIVYQNGSEDNLATAPETGRVDATQINFKNWWRGSNTVSFVMTDFFFSLATISYERKFLSDHLSIRIPFSLGFNYQGNDTNIYDYNEYWFFGGIQQQGYYNRNKIFSTGLEVFVSPFRPGKVNYFVGPSFGYGQFHNWVGYQNYYTNDPVVWKKEIVDYYGLLVKNGINLYPLKNLNVSMSLAMGIYKMNINYDYYGYGVSYAPMNEISRAVEANISVGIRF
ncbi:MAG: hypothetical protein M3Q95_01080 [Bacteroidota bacterium]|nr:hypothetical protein [Bacteroidota bacterium]